MSIGIGLGGFASGRNRALQRQLEQERIGIARGQLDETKKANEFNRVQQAIQLTQKAASDIGAGLRAKVESGLMSRGDAIAQGQAALEPLNKQMSLFGSLMGRVGMQGVEAPLFSAERMIAGALSPEEKAQQEAQAASFKARAKAEVEQEFAGPDTQNFINPETGDRVAVDMASPNARQQVEGLISQGFLELNAQVTGTEEEVFGLGKKAKDTLEDTLIGLNERIARMQDIMGSFDPKLLTVWEQWKVGGAAALERLGVDLTPGLKQDLERFTEFQKAVFTNLNRTIKEITGAQMSEPEAKRISKEIPTLDDSPTQFLASARKSLEMLKLAKARTIHMRRLGLEHDFSSAENPPISLDGMREVVNQRYNEVLSELKAQRPGISQDELRALGTQRIRAEFGL